MVGILLPGQDYRAVIELLPINKQRRVIDSQLTAMRFAGIQEIYLLPNKEDAQAYANAFSSDAYQMMGIYPRIIYPGTSDPTERFLFALEECGKDRDILISESTYIVPPDGYYEMLSAKLEIDVGVRIFGAGDAVYFTQPAVQYVIQNRINPSIAGEKAAKVYDSYTHLATAERLITLEYYLKYVKGNV